MNGSHLTDPCATDKACGCTPAEFVRLRYFFGQRLGVVDLADEQSYLVGKQRFHNSRAHGAGVLCGLRAERYTFAQGGQGNGPTTLLRVRRGAALDACGREVVVGADQCIDVAAWFAQHPPPTADEAPQRLWVALCYRECPSDPAPAPRDPCGCESGGCEFARVREGFQLRLVTEAEAQAMAPPASAALARIAEAMADGATGVDWPRVFARIGGDDCPTGPDSPCLLLSAVDLTLDATGATVTDIGEPDNTPPERLTLLPTWLLQQGQLRMLASAGNAGLIATGPTWSTVSFTDGSADGGTLRIDLADQGVPLARDPVAAPAQLAVTVSRFNDDGTWTDTPPATVAYAAGAPAQLQLGWTSGLADGGRYRVLLVADAATPPVDTRMRPLAPPSWSRHLRLRADGGVLTLADTLFD